jgi:hypothetical protein
MLLSLSAYSQKNPVPPGVPVAPIPADPHELVTGPAQLPATPAERAAALNLLERARQNGDMHVAGSAPFILKAQFTSTGSVYTGPGEITETWLNGRNWRWTASLGDYSQVRTSAGGHIFDEKPVDVVPMRVQMLRAAIFNPVHGVFPQARLRTATVESDGRQVTCLLSTEHGGKFPAGHPRFWEEREYCVANDSGLLQVYSEAPGVYVEYGYGQHLQFHGRAIPDQITVYMEGSAVIEAQISITDAGSAVESLAAARPSTSEPPVMLGQASRFTDIQTRAGLTAIQPVIVHVTTNSQGILLEEELVTASDPALAQTALQIVKDSKFSPMDHMQREAYVNVRFSPARE